MTPWPGPGEQIDEACFDLPAVAFEICAHLVSIVKASCKRGETPSVFHRYFFRNIAVARHDFCILSFFTSSPFPPRVRIQNKRGQDRTMLERGGGATLGDYHRQACSVPEIDFPDGFCKVMP